MDWSNPIIYELGLTIVALVAFAVWQTVTLKRDMRRTQEEERNRMPPTGAPMADDAGDDPSR